MKHTNKQTLAKGIKYLAAALPLSFAGPVILFSAFNNRESPLFVAVLILGAAACLGSIFFMFKGIKTLIKALFDD